MSLRASAIVVLALVGSACVGHRFLRHIVVFDKAAGIERLTTTDPGWDHSCKERMSEVPYAYRITRPDYTLLIMHTEDVYNPARLYFIATSSTGKPLGITGHADMPLGDTRPTAGVVVDGGWAPPRRALSVFGVKEPTHSVWLPAVKSVESSGNLVLDIFNDKISGHEELKFRNTWAHCLAYDSL